MSTEKLNTVKDLTRVALNLRDDGLRFAFKSFSSWKYVDQAAGDKWYAEQEKISEKYRERAQKQMDAESEEIKRNGGHTADGRTIPEYVHYMRLPGYKSDMDKHSKLQPEQHHVLEYFLEAAGRSSKRYELDNALGVEVEKVWTHEKRHGYRHTVGTLSLKGLLKRLGAAGFEEQLKAAREAEQARIDKNIRNSTRTNMRDAVESVRMKWERAVQHGTVKVTRTRDSVLVENYDGSQSILGNADLKLPDALTLVQILDMLSTDEEVKNE